MRIGYARVSTADQDLALQEDALNHAKCERIFTDTMSGAKTSRPGFDQLMDHLRSGDTLVVWKFDRIGRSLQHLIGVVKELERLGVNLVSLTEQVDTTTPGGKMIFHIFGAIAEFERDLIRERVMAGMAAAKARGRQGGRPRSPLADPVKMQIARQLMDNPNVPVDEVCRALGVKKSTLYNYLSHIQPRDIGE